MLDSTATTSPQPTPQPPRAPETDAESHARHREQLRQMAEFGMQTARLAVQRIERNEKTPNAAEPCPSLTLARATHAVRQAILLEQRIIAGNIRPVAASAARPATLPPRPATAADPRRALLRQALREAAARAEPDAAPRNQLFRFLDERLDAHLLDDPDGKIATPNIFFAIAEQAALPIDVSKLSDEVLGIPPRRYTDTS